MSIGNEHKERANEERNRGAEQKDDERREREVGAVSTRLAVRNEGKKRGAKSEGGGFGGISRVGYRRGQRRRLHREAV